VTPRVPCLNDYRPIPKGKDSGESIGTYLEGRHAWSCASGHQELSRDLARDLDGLPMPVSASYPTRDTVVEDVPSLVQILEGNTLSQCAAEIAENHHRAYFQKEILDALPANVALLDAAGGILMANESWQQFALTHGFHAPAYDTGANYLMSCDIAESEGSLSASRAAAGIRSILQGSSTQFSMEYVLELPTGDAWFLMMVAPVGGSHPTGATVMHLDISSRKHDEGNLWRFAAAVDSLVDGVFLIDRASMKLIYVNDAACHLHGLSHEQLMASNLWDFQSTSRAEMESKYDRILAAGGTADAEEILWRRVDGTQFWAEIRRHVHYLDGAVNVVILVRDITARKTAESRIHYLNRVHAILSGINTLIVRVNNREELFHDACRIAIEKGGFPACWIGFIDRPTGKLVTVASAGMSREYLDGVTENLRNGSAKALERSYVTSALRDKEVRVCNDSRNDQLVMMSGDLHEAHGIRSFAMLPLIVADEAVGVIALCAGETDFFHDEELRLLTELASDVSFAIDHIEKQERLDYLAFYDSLTGLANRHLFLDRLAQFIRNAEVAGRHIAVCVADLERFRNFNDSLGTPSGDALLKQVAEWLVGHFGDAMSVSRLDSDHFAVVLSDVENEAGAVRIVEALINSFAAHTFCVNAMEYRMALKVGVSMFPDDGAEPNLLFKNAGAALTKAKVGCDPYLFYALRMTDTVAGRLGMENQLRQALEREEFVLYYQPKINLDTGKMVGAEALLRWNDRLTGIVLPARFIPLLEETGLIFEVGRWVLRKAIEDHVQWREAGYPGIRIAVNVSPLQLRHSSFVADIQRYARTEDCVSAGLELEITETLIMEDVKRSIAALKVIRELGITIAIDDFGTGYSSLSQLAKLPVDTLKIDRSFIFDMTAEPSGTALVSTIINLAHSLNLNVVAEGVETPEQATLLHTLACDEAQGYLYSEPLPAKAFENQYLRRIVS
jgi:diguanylate cyclase (GGDEF)-like protein/PAS domain S-box-containing protein